MVLVLCLLQLQALANNYYISVSTGDDTRTATQAQNPATPWKTIAPVKAIYGSLLPGDSILFFRGEKHLASDIRPTVSGTAVNPIVFGAYGTGANPILSGATTITGFTATATPGVFSKTLSSASAIRFVFKDAERQPIARHPNSGFFYTTSIPTGTGNTSKQNFIDNTLPQTTTDYWKGANVGIRFEDWEWFNDSVTAYNGSTKQITLKSAAYNNLRSGWGYYFTNKLEIVDSVGEWYQNGNTLYYYQPVGTDPATISLDIVQNRNAFYLRNINYISVVNLTLDKYASDIIYVDVSGTTPPNNQGLSFINVATSYAWTRGMELRTSTNTLIQNCKFSYAQYEGVGLEACIGTQMRNSVVTNTGLVAGLQYRAGSGIIVRPIGSVTGSKNYITECTVDSSGKYGIRLEDSLTVVERCRVKNSSLTTTDIGAIYLITAYCGKDTVRACFTSETGAYFGGYPLSSIATASGKGMGLYVDDFAHDVWLENNTSFNNSRYGFHLINGRNVTLRNNLTYGNGQGELSCSEANSRTPRIPAGWCKYDIQNNTFFATSPQEVVVRQETQDYNGSDFGTFNNNLYHHPTDKEVFYIFRPMHLNEPLTSPPTGQTFKTLGLLTLPEFQTFSGGQDMGSKTTRFKFKQYSVTDTLSANLIDNGSFETDLAGWTNESSTDFTMSQVTALNGKALSYKYTGSTIVNRKNFTFNKVLNPDIAVGDYLQLKFTTKATTPYTTLRPFFAQNISPYGSGGFGKDVGAKTTAEENDIIFQVTPDFKASSVLKFASTMDAGEYFLDDVSLQKVSVTANDVNNSLFFTNPSSAPQTFALNDATKKYFTLDSVAVSGSITVPAWSSAIVFAVPTSNVILPVSLVNYEIVRKESSVAVQWKTAAEPFNDRFVVEWSRDGLTFTTLATVAAKGNASSGAAYSYLHTTPANGANYYRVTQVDKDGRNKTYGVRVVFFSSNSAIQLFPSPAKNIITLRFNSASYTTAELTDASGKILQRKSIADGQHQTDFTLDAYSSGLYFVRLIGQSHIEVKSFIKE